MLLIQNICLTWTKQDRGAEGEQARRRFPTAYPLEKLPDSGGVLVHTLNFLQKGKHFMDASQELLHSLEKSAYLLNFSQAELQREIHCRVRQIQQHRLQVYASAEDLNLTNLAVRFHEGSYSAVFFHDEQRSGKPVRRGHNQDFQNPDSPFFGKNLLNETAFVLTPEQYGQILWNERRTDCDTGEWYWQLHIYNLYSAPGRTFSRDIFVRKRPNLEYRQLAVL